MNSSTTSFKVFLSHKHSDADLARAVRNELSNYSPALQFFLSSPLAAGVDWASEIRSHLDEADLMLVLFTDPSEEWDWCLYEAGLFFGSSDKRRRIVCIYSPEIEPPAAVKGFQTVQATADGLGVLVRALYGEDLTGRGPLNPAIAGDQTVVRELSERLASLFAAQRPAPRAPEVTKEPSIRSSRQAELGLYCTHLFLTLDPRLLHNGEIPGNATVSSNNMELFGLQEAPMGGEAWTWELFKSKWTRESERLWLDELGLIVQAAVEGRIPPQVRGTYGDPRTHRVYRAILHRCVETTPEKITFQVVMAEQLEGEGAYTDGVDPSLVFVISSFREEMEPIFEGVDAAAKACELRAERVKDILGDYRITDKIIAMIRQAQYVVADLSYERPNVYFELGYARGLGKRVITIARKGTALHFDVKDWTCIFYDDSRSLEKELIKRLEAERGRRREVERFGEGVGT